MENFWSVIWVVVWSFVFVAYLFVLFYILTDLFRDHQLSGWFKAIWIIGLIFVPYLTALIYIIARGTGMAQRQQAAIKEARSETDAYIKHVAATGGGSAVYLPSTSLTPRPCWTTAPSTRPSSISSRPRRSPDRVGLTVQV